jgi:hypothetical protein
VAFNGTHRGGDQWPAAQSERYVVGRSVGAADAQGVWVRLPTQT